MPVLMKDKYYNYDSLHDLASRIQAVFPSFFFPPVHRGKCRTGASPVRTACAGPPACRSGKWPSPKAVPTCKFRLPDCVDCRLPPFTPPGADRRRRPSGSSTTRCSFPLRATVCNNWSTTINNRSNDCPSAPNTKRRQKKGVGDGVFYGGFFWPLPLIWQGGHGMRCLNEGYI